MRECCEAKTAELAQLKEHQGRALKIVLLINAAMFVVEATAGVISQSTSLMADSLDMLGDAVVYAFSLYVLHRSARWQSSAASLKGLVMLAFGVGVLGEAVLKLMQSTVPAYETMGWVGVLALGANTSCLLLLLRHRHDDINMSSTWLCSRNDIIANVGVLLAALGVRLTESFWPDVAVGGVIATLFVVSAAITLKKALSSFRPPLARVGVLHAKESKFE